MNHFVQPFIPLRGDTYKDTPVAQRIIVGYQDYMVQAPPQDDVPRHYIGAHEYTWFQQYPAFLNHANLPPDGGLHHSDVRTSSASQQQMSDTSVRRSDSGTKKGLVAPTAPLDTAGSQPKMPRPKAGRLAIKTDSSTVAAAKSQPPFQSISEATEPKPAEQRQHPKIRDWAYVLRAPPRVDIPQHYVGEYTWFQRPTASPYHANLPQDDTTGRGQQPTNPPHQSINSSPQHSKPRWYRGRYIGSWEYPKSQKRSNPLQHRGSQWNGAWGQMKRPESTEPRSPFAPCLDPLPAFTSYVTPINFVEPVPEARLPVVPSVASSVPMVPPGDLHAEHIVPQLTGSKYPGPTQHTDPQQYPGSRQHTDSSSYAGWGRMTRPESSEPRSPFIPSLDQMPASTPYVPPDSLVGGNMTSNLSSRPGTAEPWSRAPQDFQPPTFQAAGAALASPRTAVSVFKKVFRAPHTIFEPISSDQSSIYNPDSPDSPFQSLSDTSPGPRYKSLPEDEDNDGEGPVRYVPNPTGGSSTGVVVPGVRQTTGGSSSGFVPPGVPQATGVSSSAFIPPGVPEAAGDSSFTSIPANVPMSMDGSFSLFVPMIQWVQDAVQYGVPDSRQAPRKTESVINKSRRVTVESITDEDEPRVVPAAPPREPSYPTFPPSTSP
ncbi:hypothetical protein FRC00_000946 [Tulasnella sp. 408]|nr:hypothetical protein FRC00_000946 [Tulasnella sp. 408]